MKHHSWFLLLLATLCTGCAAWSRPFQSDPRAGRLPEDTVPIIGRLENGLVFYIRSNREPERRAELRLVVNVGSVQEDDDQRGLAHFVEHMAFNGTRSFQKQALVDYLESVGMRFGPDINAYTGFDETVYMLQLPTDTAGVLDTGLRILEEWASGVTFDSLEVEKERGVVIEEWRLGRGAGARIQDRHFAALFEGSRYAVRLPIGDRATLASFDHAALRRFYHDWYRPDLMAVVAVGDFDPREMEAMVRERFAPLQNPSDTRRRHAYSASQHRETRYAIAADPEATGSSVSIVHTVPARSRGTVAEYRQGVVESLYSTMMDDRLSELTQRPDAPFLGVSSYYGSFLRPVNAFVLSAEVRDNGVERGLASVWTEAERVARFGFTAGELKRAKAELVRAWEQIYAERSKTTSGQLAGQYVGHFLFPGPLLSLDTEVALHRQLIPSISVDEVNARARAWLRRGNAAVLVTVPEKEGISPPSEASLAAAVDAVARQELKPYVETVGDGPLLVRAPVPGRVVSERLIPEVGVTEWTLSNGVRMVLKPTDFREDEIALLGRSAGGTSLYSDADFLAAQTATAAAQVGGVGTFSVVDLQKRLSGTVASVGTDVGELHEGISGHASPRDVETMFQLVHLYFTAPRRDPVAWEAYRERARESVRNRGRSPEGAFLDTLTATLAGGHPRARPFTSATFDSLDLDRSLAIYRERFADAGGFTFYVVGRFAPDSLRPLVERYLASLPSTTQREQWRDVGKRTPGGVVRKTVRRGVEPKARTQIVFTGPADFSRESARALGTLGDVLELRLRERLREELGGTYGARVATTVQRDPISQYRLAIDFGAAPDRLEELTRGVFAEIAALKANGATASDLIKVRETQRRTREINLRDNEYWLNQLLTYDRYGWDPREITAAGTDAARFTPEQIRLAARRYLDARNYVQVSLVPEGSPDPAVP